jgi:hydrogenase maturation protease
MDMTMYGNSRVLILGLGNLLLQDEGLGIKALQQLSEGYVWPENVVLLDGGVMGLELLPYLENADKVLILDAVHHGKLPGSLVRLANEQIPTGIALKYSMHQVNFQETLAMAHLRDTMPKHVVLWGIEPDSITLGIVLTPTVSAHLPALTRAVMEELAGWGIIPAKRMPTIAAKTPTNHDGATTLL